MNRRTFIKRLLATTAVVAVGAPVAFGFYGKSPVLSLDAGAQDDKTSIGMYYNGRWVWADPGSPQVINFSKRAEKFRNFFATQDVKWFTLDA